MGDTDWEMVSITSMVGLVRGRRFLAPDIENRPIGRFACCGPATRHAHPCGCNLDVAVRALTMASYARLMGEELAKIAFADPPYNVKIAGFVSQSARLAHREFADGGWRDNRGRVHRLPEMRDGLRSPL